MRAVIIPYLRDTGPGSGVIAPEATWSTSRADVLALLVLSRTPGITCTGKPTVKQIALPGYLLYQTFFSLSIEPELPRVS